MEFIDLKAQWRRLQHQIDAAMSEVLKHGRFIMGPEIAELEDLLAARSGVRHAVSCASGTDALLLVLIAWGVGSGDAVFVPAFTFAATAEAVSLTGATPVFVDVDRRTFNMDPASLARAATMVASGPLHPAAVLAVDLFGQPADYDAIGAIAADVGVPVLCDAAQSFGAKWKGQPAASFGAAAATSFFPAKPLGCYGDGGAVLTNDDDLALVLRSLRVHGQGIDKYDNVRVGLNSRLDTLQAAILLQKLSIFDEETEARQVVAVRYANLLPATVMVPLVGASKVSAWAQYTIQLDDRDAAADCLAADGIPTAIYYPKSLAQQVAFAGCPTDPLGLPAAAELSKRVLSLPMHPYLTQGDQEKVAAALSKAIAAR